MTISASTPTRVVVLLTSISLALVLLLAGAKAASASDTPVLQAVTASVEHTVVVGDTLWDIATVYTDPGDDVRDTIYDIKAANGMPDSIVRTGQVLVIPLEF
jgi:nucleoid-associated protein YgaU